MTEQIYLLWIVIPTVVCGFLALLSALTMLHTPENYKFKKENLNLFMIIIPLMIGFGIIKEFFPEYLIMTVYTIIIISFSIIPLLWVDLNKLFNIKSKRRT